ncbi:MAG: class I SAM-dependent RNA methyltransferase [Actinomycetota bacterium]|nr:class I SAM-dependent RNA methyltransferase [Actinomycetota bacterium]
MPVGGAEFGHISRERQRRLKADVLAEQLRRLAGIDLGIGTGDRTGGRAGGGTGGADGERVAGSESSGSALLTAGVEDVDSDRPASGGADAHGAALGWRTRAGFAVTGTTDSGSAVSGPAVAGSAVPVAPGRLGMHAHRSEAVLPIREMPLASVDINALRLWEIDLSGIVRIEVSAPANGSAPLVLLATDPQLSAKARGLTLKRIAAQLQHHAAGSPGTAGTAGTQGTQGAQGTQGTGAGAAARAADAPDSVAGPAAATGSAVSVAGWEPGSGALTPVNGRGWVSESAAGHEFRVSGGGFWQIHRRAPEVLTGAAMDFLTGEADGAGSAGGRGGTDGADASGRPDGRGKTGYLFPGATVADLYAGAGLFTASLADAVGPSGSVLSVEGSMGTSKDARKNLHAAAHVEIQRGRVERVLQARRGQPNSRFDAVVLDPPRAGAGKTVVRHLIALAPRAVVYVSCDLASFARDVGYFRAAGWNLSKLRAFDLYPHTHHLETVALLTPGAGS